MLQVYLGISTLQFSLKADIYIEICLQYLMQKNIPTDMIALYYVFV